MLQSCNNWYQRLELGTFLTISVGISTLSGNYALAQTNIVPDNTLGAESSTVLKPDAQTDKLQGGATRGTNLYHSFEKFSIPANGVAHFDNASNIQNIISRVTGGSVSNIDGKLKANGTANVFLLNPNGIIFGKNASLEIGGSFVASTASSLKFKDGTNFSATEPQATPLLTVSAPIGLQFGAGAGSIINRSVTAVTIAVTDEGKPVKALIGLQVDPGKTLALVGGDVALEGGYLTAPAGRVELGSIATPSVVNLTPINNEGWAVGYEGVQNFGNIELSQAATVNASGVGGGDVRVQGRRVSVLDGSNVVATSLSRPGGTLEVNASESVELIGFVTTEAGQLGSNLRTDTFGSGAAGDVRINTGKLIVRDGAFVSSSTFPLSQGQGGKLVVTASDSVELSGTSQNGKEISGLSTLTQGAGNAGSLTITTGKLIVRDQAFVTVSSQRPKNYTDNLGNAGNLDVTAGELQLDNQGQLIATTDSGQGGNIDLLGLDLLLMRDNSLISARSLGNGQDGNVNIDADILVAAKNSDIIANNFAGPGANIEISTQGFFLSPDSQVTASGSTSIEGTVEVENPDVLPQDFIEVTGLIVQSCSRGGGTAQSGQSEFIITGRGGLPPTPREALGSELALVDLGKPIQSQENSASVAISTAPTSSLPNRIVEAQGWVTGANGEVVLTATAGNVTPHSPWLQPTSCRAS